ncbi:MAG TPA: hypothetical protein VFN37_14155 [Candidatus Baltobacteraceae bacterium]|nr:hypothetical protein [Candidatus Baltobacteraceae bacterium]
MRLAVGMAAHRRRHPLELDRTPIECRDTIMLRIVRSCGKHVAQRSERVPNAPAHRLFGTNRIHEPRRGYRTQRTRHDPEHACLKERERCVAVRALQQREDQRGARSRRAGQSSALRRRNVTFVVGTRIITV